MKTINDRFCINDKRKCFRRTFSLGFLFLSNLLLLTQCKDPVGWVAYGPHIEFTENPVASETSNGIITVDPASAEITIKGDAVASGNILYFCGPHGKENPGTLYGTASEITLVWFAAGFTEMTAGTAVDPYAAAPAGLGFNGETAPVLDIYAVANETYSIDGGKEVSPWRVSNPSVVDLNPSLEVTFNNVPKGTEKMVVSTMGVTQTFSGSQYADGGSVTVKMTGISPSLVGTTGRVDMEASSGPVILSSNGFGSSALLTMGTNSKTGFNCVIKSYSVKVQVVDNSGAAVNSSYTYSYTMPSSGSESATKNLNNGSFTISGLSMDNFTEKGKISVTVNGKKYTREICIKDMVTEYINNGVYTYKVVGSSLPAPALTLKSFTAPGDVELTLGHVEGASFNRLYRNGNLIATLAPSVTGYLASGLSKDTLYSYTLAAVDSDGNAGPQSDPVDIKIWKVTMIAFGKTSGTNPDPLYALDGVSGYDTVTLPSALGFIKNGYQSTNNWCDSNDSSRIFTPGSFTPSSSMVLDASWNTQNLLPLNVNTPQIDSSNTNRMTFSWQTIIPGAANYYIMYTDDPLMLPTQQYGVYSGSTASTEGVLVKSGRVYYMYWVHTNGIKSPYIQVYACP